MKFTFQLLIDLSELIQLLKDVTGTSLDLYYLDRSDGKVVLKSIDEINIVSERVYWFLIADSELCTGEFTWNEFISKNIGPIYIMFGGFGNDWIKDTYISGYIEPETNLHKICTTIRKKFRKGVYIYRDIDNITYLKNVAYTEKVRDLNYSGRRIIPTVGNGYYEIKKKKRIKERG